MCLFRGNVAPAGFDALPVNADRPAQRLPSADPQRGRVAGPSPLSLRTSGSMIIKLRDVRMPPMAPTGTGRSSICLRSIEEET
jgi:hypothetical protein